LSAKEGVYSILETSPLLLGQTLVSLLRVIAAAPLQTTLAVLHDFKLTLPCLHLKMA
jgi:hypothetical protein